VEAVKEIDPRKFKTAVTSQLFVFIYSLVILAIIVNSTVNVVVNPDSIDANTGSGINTGLGIALTLLIIMGVYKKVLNLSVAGGIYCLIGLCIYFSTNIITYFQPQSNQVFVGKTLYIVQIFALMVSILPSGIIKFLYEQWSFNPPPPLPARNTGGPAAPKQPSTIQQQIAGFNRP